MYRLTAQICLPQISENAMQGAPLNVKMSYYQDRIVPAQSRLVVVPGV